MISFFLSILLLVTMLSCSSSKVSVSDYADAISVDIGVADDIHTSDDILSVINASRKLDLSGIKIEFFPPDSLHPSSRASPRSISVEKVTSKEFTEQSTLEMSSVDEQKTVNLSAQSATDFTLQSKNDIDLLHPDDGTILTLIIAVVLIFLFLFLKLILKLPRSPS